MDKNEKIPTLEEYSEAVKEALSLYLSHLKEAEIDSYLATKDSKEDIENAYNEKVKRMEDGKITRKIFLEGAASSTAHNLYMLY